MKPWRAFSSTQQCVDVHLTRCYFMSRFLKPLISVIGGEAWKDLCIFHVVMVKRPCRSTSNGSGVCELCEGVSQYWVNPPSMAGVLVNLEFSMKLPCSIQPQAWDETNWLPLWHCFFGVAADDECCSTGSRERASAIQSSTARADFGPQGGEV